MRLLNLVITIATLLSALSGAPPEPGQARLPAPVPCADVGPEAHGPPLGERFQAELGALRAEYGFPGATAAFVLPDGRVAVAATGWADVERGVRMSADSRMLAASVGKTFVAATVLAQAAEGRLGLDDPLSEWLADRPWFERLPNHDRITLRHLLTHSSGIPDHVYSPEFARAWIGRPAEAPPLPPDSLVGFVLDRAALFPPGEGWAYTDTGYILLGMVAEAAAGADLYDEIDRRFLRPLGLDHTSPSDRRELPGLAAGYLAEDNPFGLPRKTTVAPDVMAWDPGVEWAGGGLVSTSRDLALWARALYEGRAMRGAYLPELLAAVPVEPGSDAVRYGAAVAIRRDGPLGPSWGHGGDIPGYTTSMRYYPDCGVAVAFQVNGPSRETGHGPGAAAAMELRLARVALGSREDRSRAPAPSPRRGSGW
jgi:D-alanyl-D-alanine carboxypeptidase